MKTLMIAFAMGTHERLGEESHVKQIDCNITKIILKMAYFPN